MSASVAAYVASRKVHLAVLSHVSGHGYYCNTVCGAYVESVFAQQLRTEDRDQVTCRSCQRTHAFREVTS